MIRELLLLGSALVFALSTLAIDVSIHDPILEAVLREKLAKESGVLTDAELKNLTTLQIVLYDPEESEKIKSLEGLEYASNLEQLELMGHSITDLDPVSFLSNLTKLRISNNPPFAPNPITSLTSLRSLTIENCGLTSLQFAAGLAELEQLTLSQNEIISLSPLEDLTKLTMLQVSNNRITSLNPLKDLPNLSLLEVRDNSVTDITPLSNVTSLETLDLSSNPLTTIDALGTLTQLENLTINNVTRLDLVPISNLTNLTYLSLRYNEIENISFLSSLTHLTRIEIDNNRILDPSPLATLSNLNYLQIYANYLTDISSLDTLELAQAVYLHHNFIDLSPGSPSGKTVEHWVNDHGTETGNLDQFDILLLVTLSSPFFPSEASSVTLDIVANFPWTASFDASWLSISQSSGFDSERVRIDVSANGTNKTRTATIDFGETEIHVIQRYHSDYFTAIVQEGIDINDESYWPLYDKDQDGDTNYFEWVAGLDLDDPNSKFEYKIEFHPDAPSLRRLKISKRFDGTDYQIEHSSTLQSWTSFESNASDDQSDQRYRYLTFPGEFDTPIFVRARITRD
ncbi:leucine-rich repeat domain-containing protein [Pelagicoccus sp. SDUM812002]|uniref:leucine-rich repeat domain-containing protein n=1 Tax=Pelagicoccus sp. SDUM812002 TaxID=3041266 RepID=UPI00281093CD|nr:leucine-rich repeat domain-containing protein [Pelagicoccus sp. SDUM812002]MDQ8186136.1 BACON domain-containing carbohydrate-binding protein [Pelagicoccus sp. SDUM812002]